MVFLIIFKSVLVLDVVLIEMGYHRPKYMYIVSMGVLFQFFMIFYKSPFHQLNLPFFIISKNMNWKETQGGGALQWI